MQNQNNYQPGQRPTRGSIQETTQQSSAMSPSLHPRVHSEGMIPHTSTSPPSLSAPSSATPPSSNSEKADLHVLDNVDSWVEIGSRPSSSSLSSATENDIITTGLRVQHDSNLHRPRRRSRNSGQFRIGTGHRIASGGGDNSSQEEYDESESESDRVLTSSNEGIGPSPLRNQIRSPFSGASSDTMSEREDDDDDDDENATAVNYPRSSRRQFAPRPNAFSHPSTQPAIRSQSGTAYAPRRPAPRTSVQRHSYPSHSPLNVLSPNAQAEHDEVLRASLSTLLSAAAAVRGLPKPGQPARTATSTNSTRVDPATLRMVPESVVLGDIAEESSHRTTSTGAPSTSSPRTASTSPSDKSKRKASPPPSSSIGNTPTSKDRRVIKKARRVGPMIEDISPTLLTWVISASVLAIVGVVSFSTGYSLGKEAGHAEAAGQLGGAAGGACSKEAGSAGLRGAGMGLKRLRWTGSSGVRV